MTQPQRDALKGAGAQRQCRVVDVDEPNWTNVQYGNQSCNQYAHGRPETPDRAGTSTSREGELCVSAVRSGISTRGVLPTCDLRRTRRPVPSRLVACGRVRP